MGINDQIWNGRYDPEVIAWRIKHVAKSFKDFVITHKDVKELGELPESEDEISEIIMKFSRK